MSAGAAFHSLAKHDEIVGLRQSSRRKHQLRDRLVHADRRRKHARADIGDVRKLEQPLDRAVFAVRAMKHREDDVERKAGDCRVGAALDRHDLLVARMRNQVGFAASASEPVRRVRAALLDDFGGRRRYRQPIGDDPAAVFFDPDGDRFVALLVEVLHDGCGRCDGNFVFARTAAVDDADAEFFHDASNIPLMFRFDVTHTHGAARRGVLTTPHGVVNTPAFMAVGTQGAVKAVTHRDLDDLGAEIILANTYHLYLRPGAERIGAFGGLHTFIGWNKPILTDSGGYQVFSLAARRKVHEEGATFRSHLDGTEHLLTPESAVDIQGQLGSDIAMALDECLEHPASHDRARESLERTLRWAKRGRDHFLRLRRLREPRADESKRLPEPFSRIPGRRSSASFKVERFPICAGGAWRARSRSASRRMPSAGSVSANRFRKCTT